MSANIHRTNAEADRAAAAKSSLPNVRERYLRSAAASDILADHAERTAASATVRLSAAAARKMDRETVLDAVD